MQIISTSPSEQPIATGFDRRGSTTNAASNRDGQSRKGSLPMRIDMNRGYVGQFSQQLLNLLVNGIWTLDGYLADAVWQVHDNILVVGQLPQHRHVVHALPRGGWSAHLRMVPKLSLMLSDKPDPRGEHGKRDDRYFGAPVGCNVFGQPQQAMEQRPEGIGANHRIVQRGRLRRPAR